jgi:AcrR family transcriptional regulator
MARTYTLKRRAEQQAETRQRIVEAAVALHGEIGPARTTFSHIAERAGVQRNTFYSHFPDERSLLLACSARFLERDPLPDAAAWRDIGDRAERLTAGLSALYAWYGRNADLAGCVVRDAESHPLVREIVELRWGPFLAAYDEVLGGGFASAPRALLRLALGFFTWRSLVRDSALAPDEAVRTMVAAITATPHG